MTNNMTNNLGNRRSRPNPTEKLIRNVECLHVNALAMLVDLLPELTIEGATRQRDTLCTPVEGAVEALPELLKLVAD